MQDLAQENGGDVRRDMKRTFSQVGWALSALAGSWWGTQLLLQMIAMRFFPDWLTGEWFIWVLASVPLYGVAIPIFLTLMRRVPEGPAPDIHELSPQQMGKLVCASLALSFVGGIGALLLNQMVELVTGHMPYNPSLQVQMMPLPIELLLACVAAPVFEEIVFRGVLMRKLRRYGMGFSAAASALTFMLLHGNTYQSINILLVGLLFGVVAYQTGSVWYTILLHMALNMVAVLLPRVLLTENMWAIAVVALAELVMLVIGAVVTIQAIYRNTREAKAHRLRGLGTFCTRPGVMVYTLLCVGMVVMTAMQ